MLLYTIHATQLLLETIIDKLVGIASRFSDLFQHIKMVLRGNGLLLIDFTYHILPV